ncbi:MAG: TIGR02281 family clan AA aspartic protease [Gammaproteobacteria bacterium]|nr:TIGR02281 family clan AA aspartic protease [Gammaproteobacteria bacterium]MBU1601546.1 TIGR02281 family clan AA aspartic protease [Gammaproteobacteria bacterium]MBU2433741.1 TIGR02281 family clan AA aspartic protease [Gammaproteobacteria bacterium]MBU2449721.1 TIGR02281 family clan AA aspartic protease [Gammaproteobacteria bacterium]
MSGKTKSYFTLLVFLVAMLPTLSIAQDVGLAGIMGSKALLMINGGEPQAVPVGKTIDGIKLLSVQGDQVIIEVGGRKRPLRVGQHAIGVSTGDGSDKIIMTADVQGHFYTTGTVNGTSVRFVVDTGATTIALGPNDARRIGLDLRQGQRGLTSTANGTVVVTRMPLDTVRIGGVTLHNVEAVVLPTNMPIALLGMSFLNRMEMQRDGSTMTLKKRF